MELDKLEGNAAVTQRAAAIFDLLAMIRSRAGHGLCLCDLDDPSLEDLPLTPASLAESCVSDLAIVVKTASQLRERFNQPPSLIRQIGIAAVKRDLERPAIMPIHKATCHEIAPSLVLAVMRTFADRLLSEGGYRLGVKSWTKPEPINELKSKLNSADQETIEFILESLIIAIDNQYTAKQLDQLAGMTRREGIAFAAAEDVGKGSSVVVSKESDRGRPDYSSEIPRDRRTKAMSKTELLRFIGSPAHVDSDRAAVDWLTESIKDGTYRWEWINNKRGFFHLDDFKDPEVRKELQP